MTCRPTARGSPAARLRERPSATRPATKRVWPPICTRGARSGATAWCDPFARNRPLGRGKSGKGRWTFVTVYPRRCDVLTVVYTQIRKHQLRPPQVQGRERLPSAGDRLAPTGLVLKRRKREGKAVSREPDTATPLSRRLHLHLQRRCKCGQRK